MILVKEKMKGKIKPFPRNENGIFQIFMTTGDKV